MLEIKGVTSPPSNGKVRRVSVEMDHDMYAAFHELTLRLRQKKQAFARRAIHRLMVEEMSRLARAR